jgi:hypothetical protein
MLRTVKLNDQLHAMTGEIDNEAVERHLPAEMKPLMPEQPQ